MKIQIIPHSDKVISFTKVALPYGWLGNMAPFPVQHGGVWWKTNEHLFQALRFPEGSPARNEIFRQASPMAAKMVAKRNKLLRIVEPLSDQDLANMRYCLELKAKTHPKVRRQLLATEDKILIEDVTDRPKKNDPWGMRRVGNAWEGQNVLGNMWMALRADLVFYQQIRI
jgi:N-glycosidase YbiA